MYGRSSGPYDNDDDGDDGDDEDESNDGMEVNAPAVGTVETNKMLNVNMTATDTTTAKAQCAM